jgi:ribosomal protein L37E
VRLRLEVEMPEKCLKCGFENFNVWGTKLKGVVKIQVRCMRCGAEAFLGFSPAPVEERDLNDFSK